MKLHHNLYLRDIFTYIRNMPQVQRKLLLQCFKLLLRPLVSFSLKHSLKLQDLIECVKIVFVEGAKAHLLREGKAVTSSRVSVMTGVHRRDVARIQREETYLEDSGGLITRVVGCWRTDIRFTTKNRKPRVLSCGTQLSEFSELVRCVNSDLNPATVLFELERVGAVQRTKGGAQLVMESYIPKGDPLEGFQILSRDVEALLCSVEENVIRQPEVPHLHLRMEYDRVRAEAVPALKEWFLKEGHAFQVRARDLVAQHDQDVNPDSSYKGEEVRVVLGCFSNIARGKL